MSRHEDSAQLSPTLSRHLSEQEDLSWLDFLRTAEGTVPIERPAPPDRQHSADRKRRHTGSEPEGRSYPYPQYSSASVPTRRHYPPIGGASAVSGASRDRPIDRTIPPPPHTSAPVRSNSMRLQGSTGDVTSTPGLWNSRGLDRQQVEDEATLPRWQPDSGVSRCPVCETEFSFWYRKHHCRKCGRVVCATCSPHRITIPRQYIVQPPNPYIDDHDVSTALDDADWDNPALGGGEVVRVCNPCVPDPWTPNARPPPQSTGSTQDGLQSNEHASALAAGQRREESAQVRLGQTRRPQLPPLSPQAPFHARHRSQTYQAAQNAIRGPGAMSRAELQQFLMQSMPQQGRTRLDGEPGIHGYAGARRHTHSGSHSSGVGPAPPFPPDFRRMHPVPARVPEAGPSSSPALPRREVKEEDECPVCGIELPAGEKIREGHIQDCIATRFSSTPSQQATMPSQSTVEAGPANQVATSSSPPQAVPGAVRPRATSYRPRGMAIFRASEKDCNTEDGEPQECVICFEEFQPGDEMGRMECLCKFHRVCIRQWWDTKGQGSCPTHQLHE